MTEQPIKLKELSEAQKDVLIIELLERVRALEAGIKELEPKERQ